MQKPNPKCSLFNQERKEIKAEKKFRTDENNEIPTQTPIFFCYPDQRSQINPTIDHSLLFFISTGHAPTTRPRKPSFLVFSIIDFSFVLDQCAGAATIGFTAVVSDGASELVFLADTGALKHCENPYSFFISNSFIANQGREGNIQATGASAQKAKQWGLTAWKSFKFEFGAVLIRCLVRE